MREINIDGKQVRVKATPLALLYYKQEFKSDLVGDMAKMRALEKDPTKIDSVVLLQMIWAMAKADAGPGNKFSSFYEWVSALESFDITDRELIGAVMEEAADGFFRGAKQGQKRKK